MRPLLLAAGAALLVGAACWRWLPPRHEVTTRTALQDLLRPDYPRPRFQPNDNGDAVWILDAEGEFLGSISLLDHPAEVDLWTWCSVHPDGKTAIFRRSRKIPRPEVSWLRWLPWSRTATREIVFLDIATGREIDVLSGIRTAFFTDDGDRLAVPDDEKGERVRLYDWPLRRPWGTILLASVGTFLGVGGLGRIRRRRIPGAV